MDKELKNKIINYLGQYKPNRIGIFGSYARHDQLKESDIDILIEFNETPTLLQLIQMENELSEILGIKVDLVSTKAIKHPMIKESIQKELILIYGQEQPGLS